MPNTESPGGFHPPIDVFLYARHPEASLCLFYPKSRILQHETLGHLVTRFIERRARQYHIDYQDTLTLADSLERQAKRLRDHAATLTR